MCSPRSWRTARGRWGSSIAGVRSETVTFNKLGRIGLPGKQHVRDLWRQQDLDDAEGSLTLSVPGHGVVLLKLKPAG